jgi:glyoxylase-like metal-dependent hydrolase (beta-lactamase superfamily II)
LAAARVKASSNPPGVYPIRGIMGLCYLLVEGDEACMIDTGLAGETLQVRRLLRRLGLAPRAIRAILLTHGHLDHAGNLAALKRWTGARIYGHPAERRHVAGTYPYRGTARWCGRLEAVGRFLLRYRPAPIDELLADGDPLPFWGGLRVLHLPGHSEGHCGFYSERHGLLFSGDLFASYFFSLHLPPPIFNSLPHLIPASLDKVEALDPRLILPNHCDVADGALQKRRFGKLRRRRAWEAEAHASSGGA